MPNPAARPAANHQETHPVSYDHGSVSGTTSVKIWGTKERGFRVDRVWYNNPTGLAGDTTNYFDVTITDGTTVLAKWSTQTAQQGTLTANTPVDLVIQAAHDVGPNLPLTLTLTLHGTQTLPAGRIVVSGHVL